jgi:exopolysaccharide biosynthesis polyprenyl glycosylphosphotransferase
MTKVGSGLDGHILRKLDVAERSTRSAVRGSGRCLSFMHRIRAWMIVLPVDAAFLLLPVTWSPSQWKATTVLAFLWAATMNSGGRYRARLYLSVLDELPSLVGRLLAAAAAVAVVIAIRHEQEAVTTFLRNVAVSGVLILVGRAATTSIIGWSRRRRVTEHRVVIIGGGTFALELTEILRADRRYGLSVAGFVDDGCYEGRSAVLKRLGLLRDLENVVKQTQADVLLIADGEFSERELIDVVRTPACLHCDVLVVPRVCYFNTQAGRADHIGSIPIMRIKTPSLHGPWRVVKRAFDVTVASALLLMVLPVLALCALAVRLEGGPGVIFRQPRVGRDGVEFNCLKLRSMRPADETESATTWSIAEDERVGPVGRYLRRFSLDELPQLWNILRGDMTLVGPRPEQPHFVSRFSEEFDRYAYRHRVQAGLTGLAQVSGLRGNTSIADRARFDNYYIENWSLWLDIKIILRTVAEVFFARGR